MARGVAVTGAIEVRNLRKRFPVRGSLRETILHPFRREYLDVLKDVTFHVGEGELFGLLGPNGAGKTTLLKILTTLVRPDGGDVRIAGHDPVTAPARVRDVLTPVIADERSLDWRLSGPANLRLFAALYKVPPNDREKRVTDLIDKVGLAHTRDRMVGTYSSGMKQRLLIARALVAQPQVLLLDEPTRSLDPVTARDLRSMLREIAIEERGCAVILATHNAEEAFGLCDRLAVLDRGIVVALGTPEELVHRADQERFRVVVRAESEQMARRLLPNDVAQTFSSSPTTTTGWVAMEGDLPGGLASGANLVSALTRAGVEVAEVHRPPMALADLIERLIERSGS